MNSETKNSDQSYSDQLSEFEGRLKQTMDDASLLQDVHRTIRELLKEHRGSEEDIRQILLSRFESGTLRQESFQLVQTMLDRIISDDADTIPGAVKIEGSPQDEFGETDVIATQTPDADLPEDRMQIGSVLRDRFLLQERVAGGSMGVVYKALDRRLAEADDGEPWVAIKVLSPKLSRNGNALKALQQEAAKGRCLSHPNIVRFLDLDRDDELYFIVMEWLEGRSLADILDDAKSKKFDVSMALDVVAQLGRALDYAHRCGVVHADVKPANVMIVASGQVKLFDFGVARILQKQTDTVSKFDPGVLGAATPAYSSMQVLTGEEPVPADDVFSLACLMYRMIAGYRVFGPRDAAAAAEEGMEPQRPQDLSDSQWKALKKALSYSRVARYSSPQEFVDDLKRGNTGESVQIVAAEPMSAEPLFSASSSPMTSADHSRVDDDEPRRRRRWPLLLGSAVIISGLAYIGQENEFLEEYLPALHLDTTAIPFLDSFTEMTKGSNDDDTATALTEPETDEGPDDLAPAAVAANNDTANDSDATLTGTGQLTDVVPAENLPPLDDSDAVSVYDVFGDDDSDEIFDFVPDGQTDETVADTLFETFVPATHSIILEASGVNIGELTVVLREGQIPAVIDLHRTEGIGTPLTLRIDEIGFSGNRSPLSTGQYEIANAGIVNFEADQWTAQTTISLASDDLSEPDQLVDLLVRESDNPVSKVAHIRLTLEDDDRRDIEANLVPNTVAFWLNQMVVRESDPAIQIDVLRLNPDSQPLQMDYSVRDITATEGEDYFAPGVKTIFFAANQRTVRLLIPLVQDSAVESDETFVLEFNSQAPGQDANINHSITVMIRDDDIVAQ